MDSWTETRIMNINANLKKEFDNSIWTFEQALTLEQSNSVLEMLEKLQFKSSARLDNQIFTYEFSKSLSPKHELVDYINSSQFRDCVNFHTSIEVKKTLSCWASAYSKGHYLTPHSDAVHDRRMTYLFYFHRGWKPEWGGNIAFDKNTHWQMFIPQAGSLVLFDVRDNKNRHMVTEVVRDITRYAITGWLV